MQKFDAALIAAEYLIKKKPKLYEVEHYGHIARLLCFHSQRENEIAELVCIFDLKEKEYMEYDYKSGAPRGQISSNNRRH